MVRFDAYSATTTAAKPDELIGLLASVATVGTSYTQGKGFHTFANRMSVKDETGVEFGSVSWGGRQGERSMIEIKGERTPAVVEALRRDFEHRCTRTDSCADWDAPGAFSRLLGVCTSVKQLNKLKGSKAGDWDDFPEDGRTLYLGAQSSPVRARLYEKGRQKEYLHLDKPDLVRLEIQVRPQKLDSKTEYSKLDALEVWGASKWTRQLAASILEQHVDPHPAGTVYRQTELETKLHWLCNQYGPALLELHALVGNWECVGLSLGEKLKELGDAKRRGH